jgi:hypothetical protein
MHRQIGIRKGVDFLRTAAQECRQLANISPQGWRERYLTFSSKIRATRERSLAKTLSGRLLLECSHSHEIPTVPKTGQMPAVGLILAFLVLYSRQVVLGGGQGVLCRAQSWST